MQKISNSALAAELNIRLQAGDDFSRVFKFWTDITKTVPVDITDKEFSIKVLTSGRSIILQFLDYVIAAPNILTISKDFTEMNIPGGIHYLWEMKQIGETVFSVMYGDFFVVIDGSGECSQGIDVVVNNCVVTIDVICTIPASGGGISPQPIPITGGVTENPLTINISDYPGFDENTDIIYKEGNETDGYTRSNDLQISETFLDDVFTGFLVTGHGLDTFENNGLLILKK